MKRSGSPPSEPARLSSGSASDPTLARLARLVREAPKPDALGDVALERVFHRLVRSPPRLGVFGVRRLAVVFAVLAVASAAVGRFALTRTNESPASRSAVVPARRAPLEVPVAPRVARRAPSPEPSADPVVPAPAVVRVPSAASGTPAASPESQLAAESKALEPAILALRRERDATRALLLLDRYEASFPHGVLSLEARVVRVDALLAAGRRSEALARLDTLPLERVGRGAELRLVRAELRASSDCRSALSDFDRVLASGPGAGAEERALRGRSLCRASVGDAAGARSDAATYLEKYPAGRFAAELGAANR